MPKLLFYAGTAFCLFLALTSAAEAARELTDAPLAFVALPGALAPATWAIVTSLVAGLAVAVLFLRMAALLAARNLFAAFLSVVCTAGAVVALTAVLLLQWRMVAVTDAPLAEVHFAGLMGLGFFVSLSLLALRPYFSIQASRFISALVFFPMPLFGLVLAQEMFMTASPAPLPASSPASQVFFGVLAVLFFSIAVHSIRHRHLFLEMTNLRELLEPRVDPARTQPRPLGGIAFDS